MSALNDKTVLVLNRNWQAVHITHPAMAVCQMVTDVAVGLDIDGSSYMVPVKWSDWIELPVREGDEFIRMTEGRRIRIPRVVVLSNFSKVPMRRPKLTAQNVWKRDEGRCQYTGKKLARGEGNLDHVVPRSRGGETAWENLVLADRRINTKKADRTPQEAGLRLLREPSHPKALPATQFLSNPRAIPEWGLFGIGNEEG